MAQPPPTDPAEAARAAYVVVLRLLAGRDLTERQLRERLARRGFEPAAIESAIDRARACRALDDGRAAAARARTELLVRGRGKARALRQLAALGVAPEVAREAVAGVLDEHDERTLAARALERRLRGRPLPPSGDPALARIYRYLISQGFPASTVMALLKARGRGKPDPGEDD